MYKCTRMHRLFSVVHTISNTVWLVQLHVDSWHACTCTCKGERRQLRTRPLHISWSCFQITSCSGLTADLKYRLTMQTKNDNVASGPSKLHVRWASLVVDEEAYTMDSIRLPGIQFSYHGFLCKRPCALGIQGSKWSAWVLTRRRL